MADKLLPCPFCGHDAAELEIRPMIRFVVCRWCFAKTATDVTSAGAIRAWNARADAREGE